MNKQNTVDCVIRFIEGHKEQAINRLFPHAEDAYKHEWRKKDLFSFWVHLDGTNQTNLVKMAVEHYSE